jgi:hypothetical protein
MMADAAPLAFPKELKSDEREPEKPGDGRRPRRGAVSQHEKRMPTTMLARTAARVGTATNGGAPMQGAQRGTLHRSSC